ncbi:MAG: lysylphosphatidylglycerol synthase transmembrane domain-containing protein [Oscillospiraceae bacterium]|nr:lysylphosphatidylglycerol synthase transmembrane domain-containing protein [Oscillospiraceae bacterium]
METGNCKNRSGTGPEDNNPEKKKNSVKKYVLSGAFLLVLMAATFYVIFRDTSMGEIWGLLKKVRVPYVFAGILTMAGFFIFQGSVIGLSAECQQIRLTPWEMMQYSFISFFYSGITPSSAGGQPMQFYYMCRDKMSPPKATLVLFITNMAYQIVIVVLGLLTFFIKIKYIISVSGTIILLFFLGLGLNILILLILLGTMFSENLLRRILNKALSFLSKIKIIKNAEKAQTSVNCYLEEFKEGVVLIKANGRRFTLILLCTAAHFLFYHLVPFFVYKAFGLSGSTVIDLVAISAVLYVALNLFPLPGSMGAAEGGFVIMFGPLFAKAALPAMLLSRFINFYTMLIFSGIFSAYSQLRRPYDMKKGHELKLK